MRLVAHDLSKSYGGITVLSSATMEIERGEIRAVVGENGAGKSTLIRILSGAVAPDTGHVSIDGQPLRLGDPRSIRHQGVSVVYQEFTLVPDLTVAENVFLGRESGGVLLRSGAMIRDAQRILDDLGVVLDANQVVRHLSVAHQQMVEIVRALAVEARMLILDEPSATLAPSDVERLFRVLRRLQARGIAVIYVSHRLEEVFAIADSITVLRDGRHVITGPIAAFTRESLIRHMVGRDVTEEFPPRTSARGNVLFELDRLASPPRFIEASFSVREGEIVGMAGLVGAGRSSVALAAVGAIAAKGDVRVAGTRVHFRSPQEAIARGVAYVTEDRKGRGLFPLLGVDENIAVTHLSCFTTAGLLSRARARAHTRIAVRAFDIRAAHIAQPVYTLSGGNQQKSLIARYLVRPPRVLIIDEPTRGIDVGARIEIYRTLNRLTAEGLAILMISSDLPEVLGMSDRIIVMRTGRTVGELTRAEATAERVLSLATAP
jgi:ABC-type sugar transport system ATPase subunit